MAWVEERSGGWLVRWREKGQKEQRWFESEGDAVAFKLALGRHGASMAQAAPRPRAQVLLGPYVMRLLAVAEDLRESTRYFYECNARRHIVARLGRRTVSNLTSDGVRAFLSELKAEGVSAAPRAHAWVILSRTLKQAAKEGLIDRSPMDGVPRPRTAKPEVRPLDVHQVEAVADAILPRYRLPILLAAYMGLRIGEVGGLGMDQVDLLHRRLRVTRAAKSTGGREWVDEPKSAAGRRTLPIPAFLVGEIERHVERYGLAPDGRLCRTPSDRLLHNKAIFKAMRRVRLQLGMPGLRFHDLRHTYAALLIREGAHPKVIQTLMGHSSIGVTLDTYGHLFPGVGEEYADRLEEMRQRAVAEPAPLEVMHQ